jgi:hypothetical protein
MDILEKLNNIGLLKESSAFIFDDKISKGDIARYFSMVKNFDYSIKHKTVASANSNEYLFVKYLDNENIQSTKLFKTILSILKDLDYNVKLVKSYVHNYGIDSPTTIHIDNTTPSVIYYANPKWDLEWGGETFILEDNCDIRKAIYAKPGRIAVIDGNTLHIGNPTSLKARERRYIIVFKFVFIDANGNPQHQLPFVDQ